MDAASPQTPPATEAPLPTIIVRMTAQGPQLSWNLQGEPMVVRPLILWMLEQARLQVLTQPTDAEKKSQLVKPNGPINGILNRLRH